MRTFDPVDTAAALLGSMADGRFREARRMFAAPARRRLSPALLATAWSQVVGVGPAAPGDGILRDPLPTARVESPLISGGRTFTASVHINADGRVTDLQVRPSIDEWMPAAYVDRHAFDEHELRLVLTDRSVGATLLVPRGVEHPPVAVQLMGGGSFDRDETSGRNRVGRDLAEGLASAGIATLRYDKPSFVDPELRVEPAFTPSADYVRPVEAALTAIGERSDIDTERTWLVGHSMGGRYAPRVASAVPGIAGLVLLAADATPMHAAAVRVARYVASLPGSPAEAGAMVAALERSASLVEERRMTLRTSRERLPLGYTAGTWVELRDDDPASTAAALDLPTLILQGGRDYQVTVADDLARWRETLAGATDAEVRVLDADDHMFFPGSGPSSPADYEAAQHVDAEAVAAIARFISTRSE